MIHSKSKNKISKEEIEESFKNLLQYEDTSQLEYDLSHSKILPPKLSTSPTQKGLFKKGLTNIYSKFHKAQNHQPQMFNYLEKKSKRTHKEDAVKLITRLIRSYCELCLNESNLIKQSEMALTLNSLKPKIRELIIDIVPYNVKLSFIYENAILKINKTINKVDFVHSNIDQSDKDISGLLNLDLLQINNQHQYIKAIKDIQRGFLELYRESDTFLPQNTIREIFSAKINRALKNGHQNRYCVFLVNFIIGNIKQFDKRPKLDDFSYSNKTRDFMLNNQSSALWLKQDKRGGTVLDTYTFLRHKLISFMTLYKMDMDTGTAKIFESFIENFKYEKYASLYQKIPNGTYRFTRQHIENKNYLPKLSSISDEAKNYLKRIIQEYLSNFRDLLDNQAGLYFPAGYRGHSAPFLIKKNSDSNTYNIIWANAGSASTGEDRLVLPTDWHMNLILSDEEEESDDSEELARTVGEVVTEYGPFTMDKLVSILTNTCILRRMKYVAMDFDDDHKDSIAQSTKEKALQSILDPRKKIPHNSLGEMDFQYIGNCFIENPDLLIKDQLATHAQSLKHQGNTKDAQKAERILNLYHKEFMVKKQENTLKPIPKKQSISIQ